MNPLGAGPEVPAGGCDQEEGEALELEAGPAGPLVVAMEEGPGRGLLVCEGVGSVLTRWRGAGWGGRIMVLGSRLDRAGLGLVLGVGRYMLA